MTLDLIWPMAMSLSGRGQERTLDRSDSCWCGFFSIPYGVRYQSRRGCRIGPARCDIGRTFSVLLVSGLVLGATALHGQSTADQNAATFEVASVKRNTSGDTAIFRRPPGGRVDVTNMP